MRKLIIIGEGGVAHTVYENFMLNTDYKVCAFIVEKAYLKTNTFLSLPVVAFEEVENKYPPDEYDFFVGIGGNQLNALRTRFYTTMKEKGYKAASCISAKASISQFASIGEHCCIFENVVVQAGSILGNNLIILPQTFVGEYAQIDDNCFLAGLVSLSGYSRVGKFCYLGTHSALLNAVHLGEGSVAAAGSMVTKNTQPDTLVKMDAPSYSLNAKERFLRWFKKVSHLARG